MALGNVLQDEHKDRGRTVVFAELYGVNGGKDEKSREVCFDSRKNE